MYSYGTSHMVEQKQDDQLEHTYSSYVRIRNVALKTCQRRWTIGRSSERGSGISMLAARHEDDIYIFIYIYIYSAIRRKLLKSGKVVIINVFPQRILLYSPSHQTTFYMLDLGFWNRKCGITVHMCTRRIFFNSLVKADGVKTIGVRNIKKHPNLNTCQETHCRCDF